MLTTIIGRGHSGTRAISHTLYASGVYMGGQLNESGDKIPPGDMYEACRLVARHVRYLGNMKWDFERLHTMKVDPEFEELIGSYLDDVLTRGFENAGWKLPETILTYPWLVRMFPDIHYIFWVRDPRDSILSGHLTDDLANWGIEYDRTDNVRERRAISWKYQADIYNSTPRPKHVLELRFEDFVLRQDETLERLEAFLGIPMARIIVRPETVGRWKKDDGEHTFPCFVTELSKYGYNEE